MQSKTFSIHLVYIMDEVGMASVFPELTQVLAAEPSAAVTILYRSSDNNFAFAKELDILERHFPARLYVSYESATATGSDTACQRTIEAIINTNIIPKISFILSGHKAFIEQCKVVLQFLGVDSVTVREQFFTGR